MKTYLIAEMACSHEGDVDLARRICDVAAEAGADAVQLQVWRRELMVSPRHPDLAKLAELELSQNEWRDVVGYVRDRYPSLEIIGCIYEAASLDFLDTLGIDRYKLHSADLSNPRLLSAIAAKGRPVHLSVGASTLDEIHAAVQRFRGRSSAPLTLMYGYQAFPTRPDDAHLAFLPTLRRLFDCPVGYQDHSGGDSDEAFWLPAAAMGLGVAVLEKHLTHYRSRRGADYEAALDPAPFIRFARMVRAIDAARGLATPHPFSEDEKRYRVYAKKSLVASRDLSAGTQLSEDSFTALRLPSPGLPPSEEPSLLGKILRRDVSAFEPLTREDFR